jgi:hypothetical protein
MSWTYFCPHCSAGLNPDETIILVGHCGSTRSLVGLHPQPGNYEAHLPAGVDVVPGSRWHFYCPVCQASLEGKVPGGLCVIDVLREDKKHRLYFSPVAGEQATFLVGAEGVLERHGRDAGKHSLDLLGEI